MPIEEIKMKRKPAFDGSVFAMSIKVQFESELCANLYIPADMLELHFTENKVHNRRFYAVYDGSQGIHIETLVKSLDDKLHEIRNAYEEIYKRISDTDLSIKNTNTA